MNSTFKLISILLILMASAAGVEARELASDLQAQPLLVISNDRNSELSQMSVALNQRMEVVGLQVQVFNGDVELSNRLYTMNEIRSPKGVVLERDSGLDVILLQGDVNSQTGLGSLNIRYLSNGLFGTYKTCKVAIARASDGEWDLYNLQTRQPFEQIRVRTWRLGIRELQGACSPLN